MTITLELNERQLRIVQRTIDHAITQHEVAQDFTDTRSLDRWGYYNIPTKDSISNDLECFVREDLDDVEKRLRIAVKGIDYSKYGRSALR